MVKWPKLKFKPDFGTKIGVGVGKSFFLVYMLGNNIEIFTSFCKRHTWGYLNPLLFIRN